MELLFNPFEAASALEDQRALFRDCFPETIGQPAERNEHYNWKFHSFPAQPPSFEYGARLGSELIGYYAAIPYRYKIGEKVLTAGMVCDVMTGSRARGKGVFTKLGAYSLDRMKQAGLDFVTGYPIRPEVIPGHLKVGWKIVQQMPVYLKILRTRSVLRSKKAGFLSFLGDAGAAVFNLLPNLRSSAPGYSAQVLSLEELLSDRGYEPFVEQWMKRVPNALIKDRDFMRWRLGAPQAEYRIVVARHRDGAIVALAVARATALEKIPTLALLDLMVLPGHERAVGLVDKQLRSCARQSGSEVIAAMISTGWARAYGLGRLGYIRSPHVFSLIVKKLNEGLDDALVYQPDRWHTMWLDSDDL
jgi:hypothetical protein